LLSIGKGLKPSFAGIKLILEQDLLNEKIKNNNEKKKFI
jgi:hypothetical protein